MNEQAKHGVITWAIPSFADVLLYILSGSMGLFFWEKRSMHNCVSKSAQPDAYNWVFGSCESPEREGSRLLFVDGAHVED